MIQTTVTPRGVTTLLVTRSSPGSCSSNSLVSSTSTREHSPTFVKSRGFGDSGLLTPQVLPVMVLPLPQVGVLVMVLLPPQVGILVRAPLPPEGSLGKVRRAVR